MTELRGIVRRYYAYRITDATGFYLPISILYLRDQGFGLAFIGSAQAAFTLAMMAAEIPSGYLGDRVGRRASLAIGNTLRASSMVAYVLVNSPLAYIAVQIVWATGWSFRSGTQDAWLYELLQHRFDESEFARIEGRGSTIHLATSAVGCITSGFLYTADVRLPFLVNAGVAILGIPILATLVATLPAVENEVSEKVVFTVREATRMLRLQAGRPAVRWLILYAALFHGLFSMTRWLEQPSLETAGVPVIGLGVLYAGFKLVSAGAAATIGRVHDRLGTRGVFALLVPVFGVAYATIALSPLFLLPVLLLYRSTRTVLQPIRNSI
ncbi:MFS transporter [Haladaptatus sp. DFWS20]|uniref:MFS transporter n=1 Tax=Haladaptatus sp. DFWS20 TaxID=3403467 RepID=UPI003EB7A52C